jgi:glutamate-ammonia-ligase adenylyltransferase
LERLSAVLGTTRFLWEEFIRYQYESILPIFERQELLKKKRTRIQLEKVLTRLLTSKKSFAEKAEALNQYKDREMFRIDLRHILGNISYLLRKIF